MDGLYVLQEMKSSNIAIVGVALLFVQGCHTAPTLRPMLDGYPGTATSSTATATFTTPVGWHLASGPSPGIGRSTLKNGSGSEVIEILFSRPDPTREYTSESQAEAYLRAIHDKSDDAVVMRKVTQVHNPHHGPIPIYALTSDYFGYRLYADCLSLPVSISAELNAPDQASMDRQIGSFSSLVASLQIKKPRGEQAVRGNGG